MRKLFYISLVVLVLVFVFSCKKETINTNAAPEIGFVSFTTSDYQHAILTFTFSDANGNNNIGLQPSDTSGNYEAGTVGYYDFYIRYYYKDHSGHFVTFYYHIPNTPDSNLANMNIYTQRLPYLNVNIKTQALSGQMVVPLNFYRPFQGVAPIDCVNVQHFRYEFWIYDRQMHKSNVVTTPEFDTDYSN
jgi:hypothetical protein